MSPAEVLALARKGCVAVAPNGDKLTLRWADKPPSADLLEALRTHKAGILALLSKPPADAPSGRAAPSEPLTEAATMSETEAAPRPPPRATSPGVLPTDPAAPIVAPMATRCLCVLELAGCRPHLTPDGRLQIAHPERVTPDERAAARTHETDIAALLAYRAKIERVRHVSAEPLPRAAWKPDP